MSQFASERRVADGCRKNLRSATQNLDYNLKNLRGEDKHGKLSK